MKLMYATLAALLLSSGSAIAADKSETDQKATEQKLEDARKRLEEAAHEVAELTGKLYGDRFRDNVVFLSRNPNRAMLGVGIGDDDSDEGVKVLSVSPGGPAAKAGLQAGDVIVELNGKSLKRDKNDSPREKLLAEMGKLAPGDDVTVRYSRDGKSSVAKFKADKLPQLARREMRVRAPHFERDLDFDFDFDPDVLMLHGGRVGDMELTPLTPKLAQYFGIDKGLLVVRAPEGKEWKLEDGDVIVDIDGRVPNDARHAFRILSSYQQGEKLTLNVWRQKKKTAVNVTVPQRDERIPLPPRPPRPPRPDGKPFNERIHEPVRERIMPPI